MQFKPPKDVKRILPPDRAEVLILMNKSGYFVMVLEVPTPDGESLYIFVDNDTAYLKPDRFDPYVNTNYVEVTRGKLKNMEVILHA